MPHPRGGATHTDQRAPARAWGPRATRHPLESRRCAEAGELSNLTQEDEHGGHGMLGQMDGG